MSLFVDTLRALFHRSTDDVVGPDAQLERAKRKHAELTITLNSLRSRLDEHAQKSTQLEAQAGTALKQDDRELAVKLMYEKAENDAVMAELQLSYDVNLATDEQVQIAIQRLENR